MVLKASGVVEDGLGEEVLCWCFWRYGSLLLDGRKDFGIVLMGEMER